MSSWSIETRRDRVLALIDAADGALCELCTAKVVDSQGRQPVVNPIARHLAEQGRIRRGPGQCSRCQKYKTVLVAIARSASAVQVPLARPAMDVSAPAAPAVRGEPSESPAERRWFWEGNVVARLVAWLATGGHQIRSVADTASKAQGSDIVAVDSAGRELRVEVRVTRQAIPRRSRHDTISQTRSRRSSSSEGAIPRLASPSRSPTSPGCGPSGRGRRT